MANATSAEEGPDRLQMLAGEVKVLAKRRHKYPVAGSDLRRFVSRLPLLSAMAGTQTSDAWRVLSSIDALVVAAAKELSRQDASAGMSPDKEKGRAAMCLLGIAPGTQDLLWGERQEAAAKAARQSVETFRREPQERLFYRIASELVRGGGGGKGPDESLRPGELRVFPGQTEVRRWLIEYIRINEPKEAHFILSSGAASGEVFAALRDKEAAITILLSHPDSAVTGAQQTRARIFIEDIHTVHFPQYSKVRVFLYKAPATLRGWHVGDRVGLSWYTYRGARFGDLAHPEQLDLGGHDNLVIVGDTRGSPGDQLGAWFDREAASLLESQFTISEAEYYEERRASALARSRKRGKQSVTPSSLNDR